MTDGNDCQIFPHGNCRNTPVEVFETRYPWFTECYRLNLDAGGPGRTRGGLGITSLLHVEADEIIVSALCDRSKIAPWGVHGGGDGDRLAYLVRDGRLDRFQTFSEAFGTPSDTKFSNVQLRRGDTVMLRSPSGGGYGPPFGATARSTSPRTSGRATSRESDAMRPLRRCCPRGLQHRPGRHASREKRAEVARWHGLSAMSPGRT